MTQGDAPTAQIAQAHLYAQYGKRRAPPLARTRSSGCASARDVARNGRRSVLALCPVEIHCRIRAINQLARGLSILPAEGCSDTHGSQKRLVAHRIGRREMCPDLLADHLC